MTAGHATAAAESAGALTAAEPPRLTGPQTVTDELIASIGTSQCGWLQGPKKQRCRPKFFDPNCGGFINWLGAEHFAPHTLT